MNHFAVHDAEANLRRGGLKRGTAEIEATKLQRSDGVRLAAVAEGVTLTAAVQLPASSANFTLYVVPFVRPVSESGEEVDDAFDQEVPLFTVYCSVLTAAPPLLFMVNAIDAPAPRRAPPSSSPRRSTTRCCRV